MDDRPVDLEDAALQRMRPRPWWVRAAGPVAAGAAAILLALILGVSLGSTRRNVAFPAPPSGLSVAEAPAGALFLPKCPTSARLQRELDFAGLPPLVPTSSKLRCLANASSGGSAYDAGSTHSVELADGRGLTIYGRRGSPPSKPGSPSQRLREGTRDIDGTIWTWAVLENGATILAATSRGVYVELAAAGDEAQVDLLAEIASTLRPVESFPRPSAREICSSLEVSSSPTTVAAAFDTTAAAIATWEETPEVPGGPYVVGSEWRRRPADEPVALCYLDGDFGPPRGPAPGPGASPRVLPNYDRVVYLVGVERRPQGRIFGWKDRIAIRDPR